MKLENLFLALAFIGLICMIACGLYVAWTAGPLAGFFAIGLILFVVAGIGAKMIEDTYLGDHK